MDSPSFFLENVVKDKNELQNFEGPLSLILMLLAKNKIEIRDIKISDILDQYLDYLARMKSMDLEIASEFVQMASQLLYIKTKTLLTGDEKEVSELEILIQSLEQLKYKDLSASVKQVIPELKKASEIGLLYFPKLPEPLPKPSGEYNYRHSTAELLSAMYSVYSRGVRQDDSAALLSSAVPRRIIYSVRRKSKELLSALISGKKELRELYMQCGSRSEIVAAFLSLLELCSMGSVLISREDERLFAEFVGGDVDEILDKIEE